MKPFFSTEERIARLNEVADSWHATPFMPNAAIKGAGVSCQKLVSEIYIEAGALPKDFSVPDGPMNWSHAHKDSLIEEFMAQKVSEGFFVEGRGDFQAGDMLGFKIGGCLHHCGICLNAFGKFIHCLRPAGVLVSNVRDASFGSRLAKIWRPIER